MKHSINDIEHLIIVLSFSTILICLMRFENEIKYVTQIIDSKIWSDNIQKQNNKDIQDTECNETLSNKNIYAIWKWLVADYKSSKCRVMINRAKRNVKYFLSKSKTNG